MAKTKNQKAKVLELMRMLLDRTDENHFLTIDEMVERLASRGISAERKSIYTDIEALKTFGLDICYRRGFGYYVASRKFELPELKLLVDSVQGSKFITARKTAELIKKLVSLGSIYEGQLLKRQVYVKNRIKSMNESIYYNVDGIHEGISKDRQIEFKYFEYDLQKRKSFRRNGGVYRVSPFALTWDDENYYMLAFDAQAGIIKHYRVDKMQGIRVTSDIREGREQFNKLDMGEFTRRTFSMFGGEEQEVELRFENSLVGVALDRFGRDIMIIRDREDSFLIRTKVVVSSQFFGWIFGLDGEATIVSPKSVKQSYAERLSAALGAQAKE